MKKEEIKSRVCREAEELVMVMEKLRGPQGCPWDQKQTHSSLAQYLLQEAYEVIDAIEGDSEELCEELGDLLLQIVFHGQIARESEKFDFADICAKIKDKLIHRHPHVFADKEVSDSAEVSRNWEIQKKKEKKDRKSILSGVSKSQPALLEAEELQSRARAVGFDWPEIKGAIDKVYEELEELQEAMGKGEEEIEEEFGDLIFALVNMGRFLGIDSELALRKTNQKFRQRFARIEEELKRRGKDLDQSDLEEMDSIWEESKKGGRG